MIFRIDARMLWSSLILCSLVKHQKLSPTTSTNGSLLVCLLLLHESSLNLRGVSTAWLMRRRETESLYQPPGPFLHTPSRKENKNPCFADSLLPSFTAPFKDINLYIFHHPQLRKEHDNYLYELMELWTEHSILTQHKVPRINPHFMLSPKPISFRIS